MQDYSGYGQPPSGDYGSTSPLPPVPPMPPRPPRRRIGLLSYLAVALAAGALGAGTVVAVYHPAASSSAAVPQPSSSAPAPLPSAAVPPPAGGAGTNGGGQANLKGVGQGLVIINTTLQYSSEAAAGTGMVINADGLVLTNNHVIENSTKITATVAATGKNYLAKVVGYDVTGDIALIQLQNASGLHPVPTGDSSQVKTGATVMAMGNAEGRSEIVSATGQVTGINQTITASDQGGAVTSETLHGMIETNANIVAGDSGGPLVNSAGKVIGMDTAGNDVSFNQQQPASGFAIPINTALAVAHQIRTGQASSSIVIGYPPFVGIYVGQSSSSDPQQQAAAQQQQQQQQGNGFGGFGNGFGGNGSSQSCYTHGTSLPVPSTIAPVNSGTLVIGTICGSPAATAGVTAGSVVTSVNGQAVGAPQTLHGALAKFRPGATVSLTWVTPSGQHKTANVTLTPGPPL